MNKQILKKAIAEGGLSTRISNSWHKVDISFHEAVDYMKSLEGKDKVDTFDFLYKVSKRWMSITGIPKAVNEWWDNLDNYLEMDQRSLDMINKVVRDQEYKHLCKGGESLEEVFEYFWCGKEGYKDK